MDQNIMSPELPEKLAEIDELLNKNLLIYLRSGEFPKDNNINFFMTIYNFANLYGNKDKDAGYLYNYYQKIINDLAIEFSKILKTKKNNEIINTLIDLDNRINFVIYFMNRSFSYLDFYYTKSDNIKNLGKCARDIYKNILFNPFFDILIIEVNKLIKEDRNGNKEHRQKIKKILKVIKAMDLSSPQIISQNESYFWATKNIENQTENPIQDIWFNYFSKDTSEFSSIKAAKDIQKMNTPEYAIEELKYLNEEEERKNQFINPIYYSKINEINFEQIIGKKMVELVDMESGVKYMLENQKFDQLSNLYELFKLYPPSLKEISRVLIPYIEARLNSVCSNKETKKDPKKLIPELIKIQKEMDNLIKQCFKNDLELQNAENIAFSKVMKSEFYSKQLSNYLDFCMKRYFKGKNQEEVEKTLDDIIRLIRNLSSKYFFQEDADKKLCERLTKGLSTSENYEKIFISKLTQEFGKSIVSKMIGMMNDLEENKKELINYRNTENKGVPNGIKFNVKVISQSSWDIRPNQILKLKLPKLFSSCIEDFENYYFIKHKENGLRWVLDISYVEIQYLYLKNKNISISSLIQILVLLELEKNEALTIKKIAENIGCNTGYVLSHIDGLFFNPSFNPKYEKDKGVIISKNVQSTDINENTEIKINPDFNFCKIKFNTISKPKKKTEEEEKNEEIIEAKNYKKYKNYILQSTITRLMKSRIGQETTHNWLINETAKQIDIFRAQPQEIKDNIEKLIEKNYIKRSEKNRNCYEYIA